MDRYQRIFEFTPDGLLIVDAEGVIRDANPQAASMFGRPREQLIGAGVEELVPERLRARHAAYRALYVAEPVMRPMGKGLKLRGLRANGTEFPIDVMLSAVETGSEAQILCVVRDVTDRRRAEQKFEALLEATPDPMVIVDQQGTIVLVNGQTEKVFGYARSELLGATVEVLVPPRFRERHRAHRAAYFDSPQVRPMGRGLELHGLRADGEEIPIEISLSPLLTEDGWLILSAIRDISERKTAQQVLTTLHEKEVLLKEIHHRVKNNLAVISSLFYLQSTYTEDEDTIRILRESQARVRSMALVHEVLYRSNDLANIDFARYAMELSEGLIRSHTPERSGIQLLTRLDAVALSIAQAVPCGLILNELVTNALTHAFLPGGSGTLELDIKCGADRMCQIRVSDDGVGLPTHLNESSSGTLGLRLIRSLARQIDATFTLAPREKGTEALLRMRIAT